MFWIVWFGILAASYLIFRIIVRRNYLRNGVLSWFSTLLEILLFAGHANLIYLALPVPWPDLPPLPDYGFWSWLLLGIMILGGVLTLGIMGYLGFIISFGQNTKTLRRTGPYSWSRNPQILVYYLVVISFALLYPSLESAAWVVLFGVIAQIMIKTEEEHLLNIFGSTYREYCEQVPRYFLFF